MAPVTEARTVSKQGAGALSIRVDRKTFPAVADSGPQTVLQNIRIDIEPRSFVVHHGPLGRRQIHAAQHRGGS